LHVSLPSSALWPFSHIPPVKQGLNHPCSINGLQGLRKTSLHQFKSFAHALTLCLSGVSSARFDIMAQIEMTTGDIFSVDVEAIVNPVNCVVVMGCGVAFQFKRANV
jgi:hypothetical protein